MKKHAASFCARRFTTFLGFIFLFAFGSFAFAQLPRPLANPNLDLREPAAGRATLALPDGGAIVSGDFRWISGNLERSRLVRIAPDGSVNTTWDVPVNDTVWDMVLDGDSLYLAGSFSSVNGVQRLGLARLSLTSGVLDSWNPNAGSNSSFRFNSIELSGAAVLLGGTFSQVGIVSRSNAAKIATDNIGTLDSTWNPSINGPVTAIAIEGSSLFLGGEFTTVNGVSRQRAAKVGLADAALDAAWAPVFSSVVTNIAVDGGNFYAVGCFSQVNAITRTFAARVSTAGIGALDATWNPAPNGGCNYGLSVSANHVYLGGAFTQLGSTVQRYIARVSKTGAGAVDFTWNPSIDAPAYGANELINGSVIAIGEFAYASSTYAPGITRLSSNGSVQFPVIFGENRGLVLATRTLPDGGTLFGGRFTRINNDLRTNLARLAPTGELDPSFNVSTDNGLVWTIASSGNFAYVGGDFKRIGASAMKYVARINLNTSTVDSTWNANVDGQVLSLVIDAPQNEIYVSGSFTSVASQTRLRLARLDLNTAALSGWNPSADSIVRTLTLLPTHVIVGGVFTTINGTSQNKLSKISRSLPGTLDNGFTPNVVGGDVNSVLAGPNDTVYVGGSFSAIGGLGRPGFARLSTNTGVFDPAWTGTLQSGRVSVLADAPGGFYIGGSFNNIAGVQRTNIARLSHAGVADPLFAPTIYNITSIAPSVNRVTIGGYLDSFAPIPTPASARIGIAAFDLNATAVSTSTTITDDAPESSAVNQSYRVTVNVTSSEGVPPNSSPVTVTDDRGNNCTVFIFSGSGTCDVPGNRDAGQRTLTASFTGTSLFLPSSDTETHTIAGASSTPPVNTAVELRSPLAPTASVRLSDGSVILGGGFSRVGDQVRRGLAKIMPDGSVDPNFAPNFFGSVNSIARDSNDNIFVSGSFSYVGGFLRRNLVKLSANGAVIAAWQPAETCISSARIAVDSTGDLYVAGCIKFVSGSPNRYDSSIFKLSGTNGANLSSSLVALTSPTTIFPNYALDIFNGQLYVSGRFDSIAGNARSNLARLSLAGTVDASFNPAPNNTVNTLAFADDGSVFLGGSFTVLGVQSAVRLAKVDAAGALVASFVPAPNSSPQQLLLDGASLYATGSFSNIGGLSRGCVARIDANTGVAQVAFDSANFAVCTRLEKSGTTVLVASASFLQFQGAQRLGIVRLDANTATSQPAPLVSRSAQVLSLARQADGATLIGGFFARIGDTHQNLVRVAPNGSFDGAFNPRPSSRVNAINVDESGAIYIGGSFANIAGISRNSLAKLLPSGALNADFNANVNSTVLSMLPVSDGLIIGGSFNQVGGTARVGIAKVNLISGALDAAWNPAASANASILTLDKDASGNVYAGGNFTTMGGVARQNLAKISGSGTGALNSAWTANATSTVNTLLVDGNELFVGGFFSSLGGQTRLGLGKVSTAAPATVASFRPDNNEQFLNPYALAKALDGNLLVGGSFTRIGGQFRSYAAKLDPVTGAADTLWNPSFDNTVRAILPGYGSTPVVNRNPLVEQNVAFGGDFEFIGGVEMPGFTATTDAVSAPLAERVFCSGFEDAGCVPLP